MSETNKPVQAPQNTHGRVMAPTELARMIAAHYDWRIDDDDQICTIENAPVCDSIESAAEVMTHLGWITGRQIDWATVTAHTSATAATTLSRQPGAL